MTTLWATVPEALAARMLTFVAGMLSAGTATVVMRLRPAVWFWRLSGSVNTAAREEKRSNELQVLRCLK